MAHKHSVYDTDLHFVIDPITRKITTECKKTQLMQKDHNSERFTFEIPRYIEGHDMSLCNVVQIHYINTNSTNKDYQVQDIYEVNDLQLSPDSEDIVIGSWLISSNATTYSGTLNFVIRFACVDEETKAIDYQWFTDIYSAITVAKTIYNVDVVTEGESSDLLEKWKEEISKAADESTLELVQEAKKSEQAASDSASAASQSEKNAGESATNAASSAQSASDSARAAIESSNSAQQSAGTASEKAAEASESAQSASSSASSAVDSATAASASAILAESYTHGRTGTREGEDTDNARYYMEQAKAVSNVNVATTDKAGIVKPDGNTITVDEDGTLHGANTYELPVATTEILGGVKPDGDTITVDEDGTLHGASQVEIMTTDKAGIGKPDGTTITVDEDGTLHGQSKVDEMTGATADKDGTSGTVPSPKAGQEDLFLRGDGTWREAGTNITVDSELSKESTNPIENRAVADEFEKKLNSDGDSKDLTTTYASNDSTNATAWADVGLLTSGEKHSSLFQKIATMFKNIRYLYKMLGTADISALGDGANIGTVTGALSKLNSDLKFKKEIIQMQCSKSNHGYIDMRTINTTGILVSGFLQDYGSILLYVGIWGSINCIIDLIKSENWTSQALSITLSNGICTFAPLSTSESLLKVFIF